MEKESSGFNDKKSISNDENDMSDTDINNIITYFSDCNNKKYRKQLIELSKSNESRRKGSLARNYLNSNKVLAEKYSQITSKIEDFKKKISSAVEGGGIYLGYYYKLYSKYKNKYLQIKSSIRY